MSASRLSYAPPLPWPSVSALAGYPARATKKLLARPSELQHEGYGRIVYYASTHERVGAGEHPLLLLHGMHLAAGAHELALLFEAFRTQRNVCVPDLPGFGASDSGPRELYPELYVAVIKQLIELCACDALAPVDVVAVGLTCEYAAQAVAGLPEMVRSLTLIDPTGFAREREVSVLERLARTGTSLLPWSLVARLGLSRLCTSGFGSVLSGAAFPPGNPQVGYTRVHCPTLVLHARARRSSYGTLPRFVRWREHYSEAELHSTCLRNRRAAAAIEAALVRFFAHNGADDVQAEPRLGARPSA